MIVANTFGSFALLTLLTLGGFIMSRTFDKAQATINEESEDSTTNGTHQEVELPRIASSEESSSRRQKRGMVLPFEPHSITFDEVVYSVDMPQEMKIQGVMEDRLVLLKGVSGAFRPGVLTALMGVSGAGKTTLMDVLAGRKTGGYIDGSIKISGYPKKQETFARISGYCEQNDIHSPHVTVHESLLYSAWLRLPAEVDYNTRKMFIEEVMELVELNPLRNSLVGLPGVNGLSTEQLKRLTIAVELVANPSIIFILSLLGLTPLAERVSFLTEQIAIFTGPTVGGLLNATCGNVTELIIAIFALTTNKIAVVKYSLLGSVLSNLLLVLGTSLLCGGIANIGEEQKYDRRQADVNSLMLLLALLCHLLPLLFTYSAASAELTVEPSLYLSRASSIVMLVAYFAYLIFQLWTHRQLFEAEDEGEGEGENNGAEEEAVIGFWSGFAWLAGMTVFIALLSEYVVDTIEDASDSWGLSVSFLSIILLPIVGNAAEHAGAIIFAFKNKLDISLGVALGSSTQIAMFVGKLLMSMVRSMD
ncbi:vacuolar cation/proton exchanger 3 isoform X2 [Lathyrus oleraceus]|uniref:vacuolar cation/proton exchanger 3 isoform X2 n=1 Tax=Pisum sativum TaxID=3888 RepID=UPI0021D0396A|nr:vacuolar cation/proton exchanger 3-like isoform X2 [Pisum sativum]